MKKIALFGGSFNPLHPGHCEVGKSIYEVLDVDEVWFLFSYNALKDPSAYASNEDRMTMGNILLAEYPGMPFVISNIQNELGTHMTYEVLKALKDRHPDNQFIWVMGADNLSPTKPDGSENRSYFERWENYDKIIQNFSIAVVDRPGYTKSAQQSPIALKYEFLKRANPADLATSGAGWCFLNTPQISMSSSGLLDQLRSGQTEFDPRFQGVADYIRDNGLYSLSQGNSFDAPISDKE